jgi:hypothetical protein
MTNRTRILERSIGFSPGGVGTTNEPKRERAPYPCHHANVLTEPSCQRSMLQGVIECYRAIEIREPIDEFAGEQ